MGDREGGLGMMVGNLVLAGSVAWGAHALAKSVQELGKSVEAAARTHVDGFKPSAEKSAAGVSAIGNSCTGQHGAPPVAAAPAPLAQVRYWAVVGQPGF